MCDQYGMESRNLHISKQLHALIYLHHLSMVGPFNIVPKCLLVIDFDEELTMVSNELYP